MGFQLLLPFETDSEEFVSGFECGRIWTLMEENPDKLGLSRGEHRDGHSHD